MSKHESEVKEKNLYGGKKVQVQQYSNVTFLKKPLDVEAELEKYEKAKDAKDVCHVRFSSIDRKGSLYTYLANGIKITMPSKNIDGFPYDPTKKEVLAPYLCRISDVIVTKVDKKNHIVTVSMKDAFQYIDGNNPQKDLIAAIEEGIKTGVYVQVPARIMSVSGRRNDKGENDHSLAIVNLGGLGVSGYVHKKDWSPCYTRTLKNVATSGEIIDVVVTAKMNWGEGPIYECNRAATIDYDPWDGIAEKYQRNSTVRVKCIDREDKGFFSTIEGVPEINVYCLYPDESSDLHIEIGKEYIGRVTKVDEEGKFMQVRIMMSADEE